MAKMLLMCLPTAWRSRWRRGRPISAVRAIDRKTGCNGTTVGTVDRIALAIAGYIVAQTVLTQFALLCSARLGERVLAELREDFVDRVLNLSLSTVERTGTGDLLSRTSRDVNRLSYSVRSAVPDTVIAVVTMALTVGALVVVAPMLALPGLIGLPSLGLVPDGDRVPAAGRRHAARRRVAGDRRPGDARPGHGGDAVQTLVLDEAPPPATSNGR